MTDISKTALTSPAAAVAATVRVERPVPAAPKPPVPPQETVAERPDPAVRAAAAEPSTPVKPAEPARTTVTGYADASSGRFVLQVRKAETREVVSQYPPAELLRFYAAAREALERASEATEAADAKQDVSA